MKNTLFKNVLVHSFSYLKLFYLRHSQQVFTLKLIYMFKLSLNFMKFLLFLQNLLVEAHLFHSSIIYFIKLSQIFKLIHFGLLKVSLPSIKTNLKALFQSYRLCSFAYDYNTNVLFFIKYLILTKLQLQPVMLAAMKSYERMPLQKKSI